ncbi:RND superfamily putative drug exporter [Thermomonospora umbrina]|uniref:RND superfamily putative drug exporter n=1 Tax=Thermomonospora umbrina TaxID=111806 RepID=A0A3D9SS41_9ACTN|nr:RND superfamily putative drug exporter [Thermomonospora umbrina]
MLVVALLLMLVGGAAGPTLFGKLSSGGFDDPGSDSGKAATALREVFGQGQPNVAMLVETPRGVDDASAARAGAALGGRLSDEPGVVNVTSYWASGRAPRLRSEDGRKALVLATIVGNENDVNERLDTLLPRYEGAKDGVDVQVGGFARLQLELNEQSAKDAKTGEMIAFPIALVALVLVFGGVVAASLPLVVAMITTLLGLGLLWLLASVGTVAVTSVNVVTILGLGLAIDYSLLIVNRYRDELRAGRPTDQAIRITMDSAGRTVLFSALTVAVAVAGLAAFPLLSLRSMAYAGIIVALLSAAASLTVLPALLALIGPRIDRGRILGRRRASAAREKAVEDGFWHRLASFVMRRPVPIATAAVAVLLLLGAPFLGIKIAAPDERVMPESSVSRQVATTLRSEFPSGEQNALQVVAPSAQASRQVAAYATTLSGLPGVARVDTITGSYASGRQAVAAGPQHTRFGKGEAAYLSVVPVPGEAEDAERLVRDIRDTPAPFDTLVGGSAAVNIDATDALVDRLPYALAAVSAIMVVLLFLLTGSVLLPFLALALSALSLTASFGALVWIFQDGHLSGLLGGFTVTGTITSTVPVMLFAVSFGLAMDYQVFLLARIREEYEHTGSGTAAVALGLERIGRIVTAAAILISIVFLAFLVSGITFMKAFGVGLPLAVLMDATLVRGALLPAAMRLAGRATWWAPGPLRRVHARFGLRESGAAALPKAEALAGTRG